MTTPSGRSQPRVAGASPIAGQSSHHDYGSARMNLGISAANVGVAPTNKMAAAATRILVQYLRHCGPRI